MPAVVSHHAPILHAGSHRERDRVHVDMSLLISNITFDILKDSPMLVAEVANGVVERAVLETAIIKDIDRHKYHLGMHRNEVIARVFDYMFGYGPLQPYIEDENISDIDGTKYNEFAIKKKGTKESIAINFGSEQIFDTYCKLIAVRNGGILNENDSHCRVTDEKRRLRINVSIKPRNVSGASISIRKHREQSYDLKVLEDLGMLSPEMAAFMVRLANTDASVLFCGKGAAGKTTLLRSFVNVLPEMERVLIVESDVEVFPDKPYCIQQRVKKQNEGGRPVTLGDLVRDGLTMSLDTYCIGEIVGEEALEFIKAAYTGHRGLATIHSEGAEDALSRLLTLAKGARTGESEKTLKEMMARSLDVIVYLDRFRVVDLVEVIGYDPVKDEFQYNRLFSFHTVQEDEKGKLQGEFRKGGILGAKLSGKFRRRGVL